MWIKLQNIINDNGSKQPLQINRENDSVISFATYFNSLTVSKWKKYTSIEQIRLLLLLKGEYKITLYHYWLNNGKIKCETICSNNVSGDGKTPLLFYYPDHYSEGIVTFDIKPESDDALFISGSYEGSTDGPFIHDINIALNICTYKREKYITDNIKLLNDSFFLNSQNELYERLRVYIQDNGATLPCDKLSNENIRIVKNRNCGGTAGFTRGLIEILKDANFKTTHVIMMDDDIEICPEAVFRTYSMLSVLKPDYHDASIGGAMLRIDDPTIEFESGASWNAGRIRSNKKGLDLRSIDNCLINEVEEYCEYNAWWYCCMPMSLINENNLPIPVFVRGDDVEYGLRNIKELILLNGICVWHEPFGGKYSSSMKYYVFRNMLIDNALHFPEYGYIRFCKSFIHKTIAEIWSCRYKNSALILRAAKDFLKGIDFLKETDAEELHRDIMQSGYSLTPPNQSDLKRDRKTACNQMIEMLKILVSSAFIYNKTRKTYKRRVGEITNIDFWSEYLKL